MNDLEERLRGGLQQLAEPVDSRADLAAVVVAGDRLRRNRRTRWTVGGIVAALVVGLAAWAGVPGRTMSGVPEPVGVASAGAAKASAMLSLQLTDSKLYDTVEVAVTRANGRLSVGVTATRTGGELTSRSYTAVQGRFWSVMVNPDLMVVLLPGAAEWVASVELGIGEGSDLVALRGLGMTAYAVQFPDTAAIAKLTGWIWQDVDGVVRNSLGSVVPSAQVTAGQRQIVMYRDEELMVLGESEDGGHSLGAWSLRDDPGRRMYFLGAEMDRHYLLDYVAVGILPIGAWAPRVTLNVPDGDWSVGSLSGTGQAYFVVHAAKLDESARLVKSVSYTAADGTEVTYEPAD